jgi:hypothetical protein
LQNAGVPAKDFDRVVEEAIGEGKDVTLFEFNSEAEFRVKVSDWITRVKQSADGVGGDDDFYDYYPENFTVMQEINERFGGFDELIEEAKNYAIAVRYTDEPDALRI